MGEWSLSYNVWKLNFKRHRKLDQQEMHLSKPHSSAKSQFLINIFLTLKRRVFCFFIYWLSLIYVLHFLVVLLPFWLMKIKTSSYLCKLWKGTYIFKVLSRPTRWSRNIHALTEIWTRTQPCDSRYANHLTSWVALYLPSYA